MTIETTARRLRFLRRHPNPYVNSISTSEDVYKGMAWAYEYALRVLIEEFGESERFHQLFYGPQFEDPDRNSTLTFY
jgi:hypothetical protein